MLGGVQLSSGEIVWPAIIPEAIIKGPIFRGEILLEPFEYTKCLAY